MKKYLKALALSALAGCLTLAISPIAKAQSPGIAAEMTPATAIKLSQTTLTEANDLIEDLESQPQTAEEIISEALGLTPEQESSIQAIFASYQPRIQESAAAYFESLDTLGQTLTPTTESSEIVAARNQSVVLRGQTYDLLFERNIAIRDVLTPPQREMINMAIRDLVDLVAEAIVPPQLQFPDNLIGLEGNTAVETLLDDGWNVVARTPSLIQLDKGNQALDLELNRAGVITGLSLR